MLITPQEEYLKPDNPCKFYDRNATNSFVNARSSKASHSLKNRHILVNELHKMFITPQEEYLRPDNLCMFYGRNATIHKGRL